MEAQLKELNEIELEQEALTISERAQALVIRNQETYDQAAEMLKGVVGVLRKIDEAMDPDIDRWHKGHKAAIALKTKLQGQLPQVKSTLSGGIARFEIEQKRIREESERKAREEARRIEEEARLALAIEAEDQGASEETKQEILSMPIPIPVQPTAPTFQRAQGVSARQTWKWRVVNEHQIPREYLKIDEVKINGIVRAMGATTKIPGIEVFPEIITAVRR